MSSSFVRPKSAAGRGMKILALSAVGLIALSGCAVLDGDTSADGPIESQPTRTDSTNPAPPQESVTPIVPIAPDQDETDSPIYGGDNRQPNAPTTPQNPAPAPDRSGTGGTSGAGGREDHVTILIPVAPGTTTPGVTPAPGGGTTPIVDPGSPGGGDNGGGTVDPNPGNPDPGGPVDPNPGNPVNPVDPGNPGGPVDPGNPGGPVDPGNPGDVTTARFVKPKGLALDDVSIYYVNSFITEMNKHRVANGLAPIPPERVHIGLYAFSDLSQTHADAGGTIPAHDGNILGNEVVVGNGADMPHYFAVDGATAAASWWNSLAHRDILYQPTKEAWYGGPHDGNSVLIFNMVWTQEGDGGWAGKFDVRAAWGKRDDPRVIDKTVASVEVDRTLVDYVMPTIPEGAAYDPDYKADDGIKTDDKLFDDYLDGKPFPGIPAIADGDTVDAPDQAPGGSVERQSEAPEAPEVPVDAAEPIEAAVDEAVEWETDETAYETDETAYEAQAAYEADEAVEWEADAVAWEPEAEAVAWEADAVDETADTVEWEADADAEAEIEAEVDEAA